VGVHVRGLDELIHDFETLPERGHKIWPSVLSRGGVQIKLDWKARWEAIRSPRTHIPHLIRGIGYDTHSTAGGTYSVEVGVDPKNRQAFLSKVIEDGTLTSAPHPGAIPALDTEEPKFVQAVADVAVDLVEGKK
jgi:hypothetical protein